MYSSTFDTGRFTQQNLRSTRSNRTYRQCRIRTALLGTPNASGRSSTSETAMNTILAADIGGTNARFTVWSRDVNGITETVFSHSYKTECFGTFELCFEQLMVDSGVTHFDSICLAVAGVVKSNRSNLTNLGWVVDGYEIKSLYKIPSVCIINDFEAVGYGISELKTEDILTLHSPKRDATGPIAILGPGTGLGEAFLVWDNSSSRYVVYPTEGSHADFAARGNVQHELSLWVEQEFQECEVEQVCSGPGIVRIYKFLQHKFDVDLPDRTPAQISADAVSGKCTFCKQTIDIFLDILGGEAANLGLKCLATGGVYIAGGIPAKLRHTLQESGLVTAFLRPGAKFHEVRSSFPLHVVLNPDVGLLGSKFVAFNALVSD